MAMKHDDQYPLKFCKTQRAAWQKKADASGMSLAAWMRQVLDDGAVYVTTTTKKEDHDESDDESNEVSDLRVAEPAQAPRDAAGRRGAGVRRPVPLSGARRR